MRRFFYFLFSLALISLLLFGSPATPGQAAGLQIPRAYLPVVMDGSTGGVIPQSLVTLQSFVTTVQNGDMDAIRGVYVQDVLAQPVSQQPSGDYGYISTDKDQVTQFSLAQAPVVGLIAHNDLAGEKFSKLIVGQSLYLVSGSGQTVQYQIDHIASYRALDPSSPTSGFVDLVTGQVLSAAQLFAQYYMGDRHVTLQTCIARDGDESWGRLLVVATPIQ